MDLRQLAALVAVSDHGTFVAAAKALHTVQSNVSAHISRLEKELGVTLVDRSRGVLTEEGEVVVARARRVQAELDDVVSDVTSLGREVAGVVRLGVIGTTARWLVPRMLIALREAHPKVQAIVVEGNTSSLVPRLVNGTLDMAMLNLPGDEPELSVEPLFEETLLLIAPAGHPLAGLEEVSVAELAEHPILLPASGTSMRDEIDADAARLGVVLTPLAEIDGVRLLATLAMDGYGPAILPATAVPGWWSGEWTRVPITGLRRRQVGLARRRRGLPSSPARALSAVITELLVSGAAGQPGVELRLGLAPRGPTER